MIYFIWLAVEFAFSYQKSVKGDFKGGRILRGYPKLLEAILKNRRAKQQIVAGEGEFW